MASINSSTSNSSNISTQDLGEDASNAFTDAYRATLSRSLTDNFVENEHENENKPESDQEMKYQATKTKEERVKFDQETYKHHDNKHDHEDKGIDVDNIINILNCKSVDTEADYYSALSHSYVDDDKDDESNGDKNFKSASGSSGESCASNSKHKNFGASLINKLYEHVEREPRKEQKKSALHKKDFNFLDINQVDEWADDDDDGYVVIPLNDDEFYEMEEIAARIKLEEMDNGHLEEGGSQSSHNNSDLDIKSNSKESDSEMEFEEDDTDLDDIIKGVEESTIHDASYDKADNNYQTNSLESNSNLPSSANGCQSNKTEAAKTTSKRKVPGQIDFHGADGLHSFFNLKVIFDRNKTGFEESKDFTYSTGTIVAGRYEVSEVLGSAAFSTALQCVDLAYEDSDHHDSWVCLKVIKNNKDFLDQSLDEIKLLQFINSAGDPDKNNVLRMIDFFYYKEHLFIVSELLKENLYEFGRFVKETDNDEYYTFPRLKKIMKQVLEALEFIHSLNLIHCDIKPENIVIKSFSRCEVKLIDFGSSCFTSDHLTTYIQSRSYRAPEVILGLHYDSRIDIWSIGAVLAELYTGYVLFQNDSVPTMLSRICGILGPFPSHVLENGRDSTKFFNTSNIVYERSEETLGFNLIIPRKTNLQCRLHLPSDPSAGLTRDEELFIDFVSQMLLLDHQMRPTSAEALRHPWLEDADTIYIEPYVIKQPTHEENDHVIQQKQQQQQQQQQQQHHHHHHHHHQQEEEDLPPPPPLLAEQIMIESDDEEMIYEENYDIEESDDNDKSDEDDNCNSSCYGLSTSHQSLYDTNNNDE